MMMLVLGSEIDANLEVCHTCDNRKCVNPNHLWLGTTQQNTQDKMNKNRHWVPKGETRSDAKLTDDAVRYIRRSNEPHTEVAKAFGVSEALIRGVRKNVYWKHVQ